MKAALFAFSFVLLAAQAGNAGVPEVSPNFENQVCQQKAERLARAAHLADWPSDRILDMGGVQESRDADKITYNVGINTGGKFDMVYKVTVAESGPQACYLVSITVPNL